MSLSSIWLFIRTVLVVTIVTGLVWLYAEGESLKTSSVEVDVMFTTSSSNLLLKPDGTRRVKVIVRCSASKKAELDRNLTGMIRLDVGDTGAPAAHESVYLKDRLAQNPVFASPGGVTIVETQPKTLEVDIERLQSITLPVRINSGEVVFTPSSTVDPQSVTLVVPVTLVRQLDAAFVEAKIDANRLPLGVTHTVQVPLTLPDQWKKLGLTLPPTMAKATFSIRQQTETYTIQTIPISLSGPPTALAKYSVSLDDEQRLLRDVKVTGPHDVIEKIRKEPRLVRADLIVTADDLEKNAGKGPVKGTLIITVPPNVTYDPPALVTYTVVTLSESR